MFINTSKCRYIFAITSVLLLGSVSAAQANDTGVYIGGGLGYYDIDDGDLDDHDRVIKTLVGYQVNSFFGVEAAWTDFNRVNNNGDRFEADGKGLAAVLSLPIGIFVKGGQFWWSSDAALSGTSDSSHGNDPFWGVGFKFGLGEHFALRLEAERYDVQSSHVNTYTAGLDYKF